VPIAFAVLTLTNAYAIYQNHAAIDRIDREGLGRRDQACTISERKQLADVQQLRRTYAYLLSLSPRERRSRLNMAVLQQLPSVEQEARFDDAPKFCDQPHLGLPEPDSKIPKRPRALR